MPYCDRWNAKHSLDLSMPGAHLDVKGSPTACPSEGSAMLMMIDRPLYAQPVSVFARLSAPPAQHRHPRAILLWPARALQTRRLLDGLGGMSDHELRDIGLTRQDLRDATALPASQDPGELFAARAAGRRRLRGRRWSVKRPAGWRTGAKGHGRRGGTSRVRSIRSAAPDRRRRSDHCSSRPSRRAD